MDRSASVRFDRGMSAEEMLGLDGEENVRIGGGSGEKVGYRMMLDRSKSLKLQRNFDLREMLGGDPSEIEEEQVELPIEALEVPFGDEVSDDEGERTAEPGSRHVHPAAGVSITEEQVGLGEHCVIAFSSNGGEWSEEKKENVFVVPVAKEIPVRNVRIETLGSEEEEEDLSSDYMSGGEDGLEEISQEERTERVGTEGEEGNTVSHLDLGPIEKVCEERLEMEDVELDEEPGSSDDDRGPVEERSRGRERVRFASTAHGEERTSRSRIRGILKIGRSASAMPYSRIRFSEDAEVDENDPLPELPVETVLEEAVTAPSMAADDNSSTAKKNSVSFFFTDEGNLQCTGFDREKSFGFAGMVHSDSRPSGRQGRSGERRGAPGGRRRARSVAAVLHTSTSVDVATTDLN